MLFKNKRNFWLLLTILFIALFFRFYNFQNLQYFSEDEEMSAALVGRMIVEKRIGLVSQNLALNFSLGSFFHLLSVPLFALSHLNPIPVLLVMSGLGVLTTLLIFLAGKLLANFRVGLVASLFYASSFVISLADRRWWTLSLNPLLMVLAIISVWQLTRKKFIFIIPFSVAIGFAGHADPTIGIIAVAAVIVFFVFKLPVIRKEYLAGLIILMIFVSPLLIFEVRHPGRISEPLLNTVTRLHSGGSRLTQDVTLPANPAETITRIFFPKTSNFAERHFCYCRVTEMVFIPIIFIPLTLFLIFYPVRIYFVSKNVNEKTRILLLYIFLLSFALSGLVYIFITKNAIYDHYYTIIFPVLALLFAITITNFWNARVFSVIILVSFFVVNINALFKSTLRFHLTDKQNLITAISDNLMGKDFSLYVIKSEFIHNGGFTTLFALNDFPPKKSYIYPFHDWVNRTYRLYAVEPESEDQEKIVVMGDKSKFSKNFDNQEWETTTGNLKAVIIDNAKGEFEEKTLQDF